MVTIETGPQNWEVIQQYNGCAKVTLKGTCEFPDGAIGLIAKVFDEMTDEDAFIVEFKALLKKHGVKSVHINIFKHDNN